MPSDYEKQAREWQVPLWEGIHQWALGVGGTPHERHVGMNGVDLCDAVVRIESTVDKALERIARDARAEEREKCAQIAENSGMATGEEIAKRIRAGEPEKEAPNDRHED